MGLGGETVALCRPRRPEGGVLPARANSWRLGTFIHEFACRELRDERNEGRRGEAPRSETATCTEV